MDMEKEKRMIKQFKLLALAMVVLLLTACVNQHPKVMKASNGQRIVATSVAVADICDRLNLDLVGVCDSKLYQLQNVMTRLSVLAYP